MAKSESCQSIDLEKGWLQDLPSSRMPDKHVLIKEYTKHQKTKDNLGKEELTFKAGVERAAMTFTIQAEKYCRKLSSFFMCWGCVCLLKLVADPYK